LSVRGEPRGGLRVVMGGEVRNDGVGWLREG
jgi:hypothetical protein